MRAGIPRRRRARLTRGRARTSLKRPNTTSHSDTLGRDATNASYLRMGICICQTGGPYGICARRMAGSAHTEKPHARALGTREAHVEWGRRR